MTSFLARHPFFQSLPRVVAHRGGSRLAPENTLEAFQHAAMVHNCSVIELDVQLSSDGQCMVIHDERVDRTTNGSGLVAQMTRAELGRLNASSHFVADADADRPWTGTMAMIPTLSEVLEALPETRFVVEVKAGSVGAELARVIRVHNAAHRVCISGERADHREALAGIDVAWGAPATELRRLFVRCRAGLGSWTTTGEDGLQIPLTAFGLRVPTPSFISMAHRSGAAVQVWTVDDEQVMRELFVLGVDGVITDRPDRANHVDGER